MNSNIKKFLKKISKKLSSNYALDKCKGTNAFLNAGKIFSERYHESRAEQKHGYLGEKPNPLYDYFINHKQGPGIWKWQHYFDIYHNHLSRFINLEVNLLEIGVYSGGSLEMWRSYLGQKCNLIGVDIEEACRIYENAHTSIWIGDQEDKKFWEKFKNHNEKIDILIDDGGHTPDQQRNTLEEMLQHLQPGGVYICEDIHGINNDFTAFALGLVDELNRMDRLPNTTLQSNVSNFQSYIHSIHFYPYICVIEKNEKPISQLIAPKHGTQWQPFL